MSKEGNILTNLTAWIGVSDLEKKGTLVNGSNQVRTKKRRDAPRIQLSTNPNRLNFPINPGSLKKYSRIKLVFIVSVLTGFY